MRKITQKEFDLHVKLHKIWLDTDKLDGDQLHLSDCDFTDISMDNIPDYAFNNSIFSNVTFSGMVFKNIGNMNCRFLHCDMNKCIFENVNYDSGNSKHITIFDKESDLSLSIFKDVNVRKFYFYNANLYKVKFENCSDTLDNTSKKTLDSTNPVRNKISQETYDTFIELHKMYLDDKNAGKQLNFDGIDFSNILLDKCMNNAMYKNCSFSDMKLNDIDFARSIFVSCHFVESSITNCTFEYSDFINVDFRYAKCEDVLFFNTTSQNVNINYSTDVKI